MFDNGDAIIHQSIEFDGQIINAQSHDVHLGHIIGNNTRGLSIQKAKDDLIIQINVLTSYFRHAYVDTKYRLFKTFCMSMYGCVLWDLQSKSVNMFHTAWRKCIRRLYGLPSRTHNDLLPTICQDIPVEGQIHVRFLKLIHDSLLSRNPCVQDCRLKVANLMLERALITYALNIVLTSLLLLEEEEECFYSTIQCNTMIRIKDIYREQFGQETPIKMQLASLSWEPPTEQTKYIMPTRDI